MRTVPDAPAAPAAPDWQWCGFPQLSGNDVHALLGLRQEVFIIEQQCIFADIDGLDQQSHHLLGWQVAHGERRLAAYLRVLAPGAKYAACSIGRVVTAPAARGTGMGRLLMAEGLRRSAALYPGLPIRIGAQQRLTDFYASFGFTVASAPYDEDAIMHVEMLHAGGWVPTGMA